MNYYLSKYVDKFRVKSEIDQNTNDFCRDIRGQLCNNSDIYIKCACGVKIFHYGGDMLDVYVPSIGRGHNILLEIARRQEISCEDRNYPRIYKELKESKIIIYIEENDVELLFRIKDKNLESIIDILKPQTSGVSISPFSPKNLPQGKGDNKYQYTPTQIREYEKVINDIPKEDKLIIGQLNNQFLKDILCKKLRQDLPHIKADMKKKMLKTRDYIYLMGYEKEYLNYIKEKISKKYE